MVRLAAEHGNGEGPVGRFPVHLALGAAPAKDNQTRAEALDEDVGPLVLQPRYAERLRDAPPSLREVMADPEAFEMVFETRPTEGETPIDAAARVLVARGPTWRADAAKKRKASEKGGD